MARKSEPSTTDSVPRRDTIKGLGALGLAFVGTSQVTAATGKSSATPTNEDNVVSLPEWASRVQQRVANLEAANGDIVTNHVTTSDTTDLRQRAIVGFDFSNGVTRSFQIEVTDELEITVIDDQGSAYSGRITERFNQQISDSLDTIDLREGGE